MVQTLVSTPGVDVNAQSTGGNTPLIIASDREFNIQITRALLEAPDIDENIQNAAGFTALFNAAFVGRLDVVQELLTTEGINVHIRHNVANGNYATALTMAVDSDNIDIVRELVNSGHYSKTQLQEAISPTRPEFLRSWTRGNYHPRIIRIILNKINQ